jgi:flagellar motor switch protein FliG
LPKPLLTKIIQSTVERASRLDQNAASDPDHIADEKTANLLRAMDRTTRTAMLQALENAEPETAERVKGMLFVFDDILRIADKSIQRLLAEVESSELSAALKNAEESIVERITSNLSKRAKATLLEEIEYLGTVSSEREAEARKAVCDVFAKLDQAGDLEMMET